VLAVWGGGFLEPDPFNYFFGNGIATNIGASVLWGFAAGLLGLWVAKKVKTAWARHKAHQEWEANVLATIHKHVTGRNVEPHPHHDLKDTGCVD